MNVGTGNEAEHAVSFLGIHKSDFLYSAPHFKFDCTPCPALILGAPPSAA
jgi:hypothetical protein